MAADLAPLSDAEKVSAFDIMVFGLLVALAVLQILSLAKRKQEWATREDLALEIKRLDALSLSRSDANRAAIAEMRSEFRAFRDELEASTHTRYSAVHQRLDKLLKSTSRITGMMAMMMPEKLKNANLLEDDDG